VTATVAKRLPVAFGPASFTLEGATYANPASGVVAATANPWNGRYSAVVFAGNGGASTRDVVEDVAKGRGQRTAETILCEADQSPRALAPSAAASSAPRTAPVPAARSANAP
jgi:hypothetical protein